MKCTSCGSENTQRLEMIYDAGTQHISTTSSTVATGYAHGELVTGTGSTTTRGSAQTALAIKAAPPRKKPIVIPVFVILVGLSNFLLSFAALAAGAFGKFLLGVVVGGGIAAAGVMWLKNWRTFNRVTWKQLTELWFVSWMCQSCGAIFQRG